MTSKIVPDACVTGYVYDAENRLVSTTAGTTLVYDALGRLYGTTGTSTGTTTFLYDGDALVAEYDAAGALLRRYVHGNGEDDPMIWYEGSTLSTPRSLQVDPQGSIVSVADASGSALNLNTYDEYGIPGSTNAGRFQYTGQAWIPELGMYYYKARLYSPTLGRFLQTDPIGYQDQVNLYPYVGNDPINGRDPTGTFDSSSNQGVACTGSLTSQCGPSSTGLEIGEASHDSDDHSGQTTGRIVGTVLGILGGAATGAEIGGGGGAIACSPGGPLAIPCGLVGAAGGAVIGGIGGGIGGYIAGGQAGDRADRAMSVLQAVRGGGERQSVTQRASSPVWRGLRPWRNGLRRDGAGRIFEWDHTHENIEVYNGRGVHIGVMNSESGEIIENSAVRGRTIDVH